MASWPTNWKHRTLEEAGITVSPRALKVLSAWRQSTPLDPWTNNPLGMPAKITRTAKVPGTEYGLFRSTVGFYVAFAKFLKTTPGMAIVSELESDKGYGPTWRAINGLKWPAFHTETDYPAKVLDLASEAYRQSVSASDPSERKTSGTARAPAAVHDAMRQQAASLSEAAKTFSDSVKAVQYLIRRHARNG